MTLPKLMSEPVDGSKNDGSKNEVDRVKLHKRTFRRQRSTSRLLWHFLLDLLRDKTYRNIISWTGRAYEFEFKNPSEVIACHDNCHLNDHLILNSFN